ncbi:MAG: pyridoxine 5'-phosphate synthase [Pseudomonadota bacterium]
MKRLHVNIDHCATVRQARGTKYPDPVWVAVLAELAGAHGITAHLREDRRHLQDRDMRILRQTVRTLLNMEMAATDEMVNIAVELKPDMVTLVPERREERTTEGGLDPRLPEVVKGIRRLQDAGIEVSLFVDPDPQTIQVCAEIGADVVELHTGEYCEAKGEDVNVQLERLAHCASLVASAGLKVAAGHGLDYPNVAQVAAILEVEELNIGHAIIARAIFVGMDRAVRDMLHAMNG